MYSFTSLPNTGLFISQDPNVLRSNCAISSRRRHVISYPVFPSSTSAITMSMADTNDGPKPFEVKAKLDQVTKRITTMPEGDDLIDEDEREKQKIASDIASQLERIERQNDMTMSSVSSFTGHQRNLDMTDDEIATDALVSDSHSMNLHEDYDTDFISNDFLDDSEKNENESRAQIDKRDNVISTEKTREYEADPRVSSAEKMLVAREEVTRRRARLFAERGENILDIEDPDITLVEREALESSRRTLVINSVRSSLPFDPNSVVPRKRQNAIIAATSRGILDDFPPKSYRPFLPLHEAINRAFHMPCRRCEKQTHVETLKENVGICSECFKDIYLTTPIRELVRYESEFRFPQNSKKQEIQEQEATRQAQNIIRDASSMQQQQNSSYSSSTATPNTTAKSDKSVTRDSGNNGNGKSISNQDGGGNGAKGNSGEKQTSESGWNVFASDRSKRTINPIRNLVQNIQVTPNPNKEVIKLSVGDPTVYGNLRVSDTIIDAYAELLRSTKANGYSHSTGSIEAREAVAKKYTTTQSKLTADDVFLTAGTSGALELVLGALANEGDNILLPKPGFPLFRTLAEGLGIECRYYRLRPHDGWKTELEDFGRLADSRTRAIVVNNPSNPCGSVFSRIHIDAICSIASALRLPIVADEVYADMVFGDENNDNDNDGNDDDDVGSHKDEKRILTTTNNGHVTLGKFVSFGTISHDTPVLVVGGISKQFVVPGWRLGWVLVHDRGDVLLKAGVLQGMRQLTTRMLVPNTPAQMILPKMLEDNVEGFHHVMNVLSKNARFVVNRLSKVPGLKCIRPKGAMYTMVLVDVKKLGLKDDMEFVEKLYEEEAVFALPGKCFQAPNFIRVVFSAPQDVLEEAFSRMEAFCQRRIEKA